jgi:hypothetical protein
MVPTIVDSACLFVLGSFFATTSAVTTGVLLASEH